MIEQTFPKVSYIVPVYNHQSYVIQTLNSILNDTYSNKELVIIDDGSTDNSNNIIKNWIDQHQHEINIYYKSRENKGVTNTLNELISISTGKYIIPMASDDYLINNMTPQRVRLLEQNPHKLMLINDAIVIDENNTLIFSSGNFELYHGNKNNFYDDKKLLLEIASNWSCVGPICILNKKIFSEVGYYNPNLLIEDWDFYLRTAVKGLIMFEDLTVAAYRKHKFNTHSSFEKKISMYISLGITARINAKNVSFPIKLILYYKYLKSRLSILKLRATIFYKKLAKTGSKVNF